LSTFGEPPPQRKRLASALRRLRQRAGLSGEELGRRVGISQTSVSRLETALSPPSVAIVEAWSDVVHASAEERADLVDLARIVAVEVESWKEAAQRGLAGLQRDVQALEAAAVSIRSYSPVVIPGLLQTSDYARRLYSGLYGAPQQEVGDAVTARLERQRVLFDPAKTLEFIVTEAALRWYLGPREVALSQLDRIVQVTSQAQVSFGVLPLGDELPTWHWHGFDIFESRAEPPVVEVETLTAGLTIADPGQVSTYIEAFSKLRAAALSGRKALQLVRTLARDSHRGDYSGY